MTKSVFIKLFVIFIAVATICVVVLFVFNKNGPSVKERLHSIASGLPKFDGHSITEGKITDGNCFGINEASDLPAMQYQQAIAAGTFEEAAKAYRQTVTKSQDITWSEGDSPFASMQSDPFVRDGKRYTLTVISYSQPENHIGISLTACDY